MKKEEFEFEKKIEGLKHKNKLNQLEVFHNNKLEEIKSEKEARLAAEASMHENKMSFHRLKRADDRLKGTEWRHSR